MNKLPHRFLVGVLLAAVVGEAKAVVLEVDDPVHGAGAITRDTDQQLDFLDLDFTLGRSFDQVTAELGVGGEFEGFRYATVDEAITLAANYGFSPFPVIPSFTHADDSSRDLAELVSLVGGRDFSTSRTGPEYALGITGTRLENTRPAITRLIEVALVDDPTGDLISTLSSRDRGSFRFDTGSYLVRQAVPEPAACLLLCLAATPLIADRRRN